MATVEQVKDSGYIQNNGLLYEQDIKVEGEYKIVGVIQSYSAFWDVGTYCLPNLFLSEEGGKKIEKALQTTALVDLSDLVFYADVFMESDTQGEHLNEKLEKRYGSGNAQESDSSRVIRRNQYAYPESTEGSETMITFLVVIVIFVVAFCAILQIFLTQIKKRTRKIALLKSIGATGGQVVSMMLWEGIYLLCYSMPIGVAAGFIVGWGAVQFLHIVMGMDTAFYMNPKLVGYGILMGCFALFAGMTVPTIKAVRVPLVGAITVTEKNRRKKSVRERIGAKQGDRKQRLTFAAVSKSHERLNWKNRIVTGIIAVVTSILLFSALYLGYLAFGTYREAVVEDNRPDYVLSASHGYQDFEVKNIAKSIEAEKKGSRVETYQRLNKVCLLYDRIDESPLLTAYKKYLPKERYAEFIGSKPTGRDALRGYGDLSMVLGGVQTTAYGFDIYGDMYKNIKEMLTVGELDENAFIKGDSVILAVPLYTEPNGNKKAVKSVPETVTDDEMFSYVLEELGGYQLSYDKKDKRKMQRDISIQPGDRVHLSVERQELTDGSQPPVSYDTWDVCVDGIIYYTPDEKIYPHFTYENGFMILGSTGLLYKISMATRFNPLEWYTPEQFEFILTQCPTKFGETYINVHTDDKANAVESATKIMKLGKAIRN